ncbi:MAG: LysR family transcriptional regulator, partial [Caulobacterales bacterium]|nr:LysR family transcriptional regulator [Caulobacterales bacterium]
MATSEHRRLPPLNALKAFEAAARHGSLARAAGELGVTAGAVSQQIRQLEAMLGVALFRRHARGVELTDAAAAAMPLLTDAFDRLREASEALAGSSDQS